MGSRGDPYQGVAAYVGAAQRTETMALPLHRIRDTAAEALNRPLARPSGARATVAPPGGSARHDRTHPQRVARSSARIVGTFRAGSPIMQRRMEFAQS